MNINTRNNRIKNIFECFLIYSILGWLYEVIWWGFIEHNAGFTNRGFLFGPWLPIYGFGMLFVIVIQKRLKITAPGMVFLSGMVITTVAELIGSYVMELLTGGFLWNYEELFLNFEGRIALKPAILFGLLVLLAIEVVHPKITNIQKKYKDSLPHNIMFGIIATLFTIDLLARFWLGSNL